MIEFKDVSVTYSATGVDALNNINLKIDDGDFVFVVGESGAGKSTLIKLLQKEIDATSGEISVNDFNLTLYRAHCHWVAIEVVECEIGGLCAIVGL